MRSSVLLLLVAFLGQYIVYSLQSQGVGFYRCPPIRLANGRVRPKARGRFVRLFCYEGFTLVGNKYSTCIRGQWNTPPPVCVSSVCPVPPTPQHAAMAEKYNGAILIYFCEPGYALIGAPEIYCDGKQWNATTPYCRDTTAAAPRQCDFEKPDLCWWEQDPHHDFDWTRHNFETTSSHIGTGPTHDHTLGAGNDGYYLYIEASGRLVNDTARIISPLYNSSLTEPACFSFWYHMYGATIGSLNVYHKSEGEPAPQLMFTKAGDQGNQWLRGIFDLPNSEKNYQIIIEGVRGSSYVSDIAIDDVAILQGDTCKANKMETIGVTQRNDDQIEIVNAQQSCRRRCTNMETVYTTITPPLLEVCQCTLNCADYGNCCPDYAEYCVLGATDEAAGLSTKVMSAGQATSEGAVIVSEFHTTEAGTVIPDYYNGNGISIIPKDDFDPATSRPPPPPLTTKNPIANVTRMRTRDPFKTTRRDAPPTLSTKETYTKETPYVPITTATKRYDHLSDQPGSNTRMQDPEKLHRSTAKFSLSGIIGLVVGILTGISITMMVAFLIVRKRKTYKRGSNGSALSEDSDVRFLTSDEILDFTLARPGDNDE